MAVDNKQIAEEVLALVGGKENITSALHCMTRLRLVLKDFSVPNLDEIKKIPGVLGAQIAGGQLQVIIGQNVPHVYKAVCDMTGLETKEVIEENLDEKKEKLTLKKVGNNILGYLSGSMIPILPAIIGASLFKTLGVLLGPNTFGLIAADSNFMILSDFVYDACFYFLPIYLGFNAAKKLDVPPSLGAFAGAVLISPDFMTLVTNGQAFSIFGLNVPLGNYSQSVFPVLLSVYALSIIYKFVKKIMPETVTTVFTPLLSMLILMPIEFCLLAPLGTYLGGIVSAVILWISEHLGFVGLGIIAALWNFCILAGMHVVIYLAVLPMVMAAGGFDMAVMPGFTMANMAVWGMCIGAALKLKTKEERSAAWSYFVSAVVGGVTEPALYGLCFRYKKPFIAIAVGAFAGGAVAGLLKVVSYLGGGSSNFTVFIPFLQGGVSNLVKVLIASAIAAVVAGVITYVLGLEDKENA